MHRAPGVTSRRAVLLAVSLTVLTVLAVMFGRSFFGAPDTALAAAPVRGALAAITPVPTTAAPTPTPAPGIARDLGTVKGDYTLRGPARAGKGAFVVFVVDGPQRVVRTDAKAPFTSTLRTTSLPNGAYTLTVVWGRAGVASVASTYTLKVNNPPKVTPSATRPAATKPAGNGSGSGSGNGSGNGSGSGVPPAGTNTGFAAQVVTLTNAERAKVGCGALAVSGALTASAQGHSADMATKNYFSHTGLDGRSPFDRMKAAGYSYSAAAENIAMGQRTASEVVTAWMNSAGHKANIVNCSYTQIGVGYATGASGSPYWTQNFGRPL